ncbi:MAG: peptidylprolyl isomerase [Clostridia bacterium]|nr:peptidylprolyl isomerase [Clostridia bacterium]
MGNSKKQINRVSNNGTVKVKDENNNAFNIVLIICAAVIALAILVAVIVAVVGGVVDKNAKPGDVVSLKSEHYEVTNGMLSYYFTSDYYTELSTNAYTYLMYGLDTTKSLKNQTYSEATETSGEATWFDYFITNTVNNVSTYLIFAEKAYENGVTELSEDDRVKLEKAMETLAEGAAEAGLEIPAYIEHMYGEGVTEADVRRALEFQMFAMAQYNADYDSFEFTLDECETAYDQDPTAYNYSDYRSYTFKANYPEDEKDTEGREAAEAAAKELADGLATFKTEEEFVANVFSYLASENAKAEKPVSEEELDAQVEATLTERSLYSADTAYGKWAYVDGRQTGDTTVIDNEDGSYTVYFMVRPQYRLDYDTKNVRHILFNTANYETAEEARNEAEKVLALWNEGEKTEAAFEKLADEYNDDSASLYENVMLGQMVTEFEDWCYDEARATGDCEIVETTYGYHIVYFVGNGEVAWKADVEADLVSDAFQALFAEYEAKYELDFDQNNVYKISGHTAYSKSSDTTVPETTKAPDTTADTADDTGAAA